MTKKDKLKKEYKKERQRVLRRIKELDKKDKLFTGKVPEIPKKITQGSINRLKKISNQYIKDKSVYIDKDTGEIFKYKRDYLISKETNQRETTQNDLPRQEDMLINAYLDNASRFPKFAYPYLSGWLNALINARGKKDVAYMLQAAENAGVVLTWEIAYKDGELENYAHKLLEFLPEIDKFTKDKLDDMLDEIEGFTYYG